LPSASLYRRFASEEQHGSRRIGVRSNRAEKLPDDRQRHDHEHA